MSVTAAQRSAIGQSSWEALGTSVVLRVSDPAVLADARAGVEHELDAIDRACSRFRPDSELSRVNALEGRPAHVSGLLLEAVELALRAAELTDGNVDPTIGRALELAGYDRDWRLLRPPSTPSPAAGGQAYPRVRARVHSGWQTVTVDSCAASVRVPRGIHLDLGATAKAWAADRAATAAAAAGCCGVLVSLGGDIATCGDAPPGGWPIRVTDDHRSGPDATGQTIVIYSGALATSSTTVRRWRHEGQDMHHIIDPRTGAPADTPWRTVSVAAASCAEANIAATAALVKGAAAPGWLAGHELPARLVERDGHLCYVGDWPQEER